MNPRGLALLTIFAAGVATAQEPAVPASGPNRRADIAAERAAVGKRYAEQERECRQRFVVTSCLDDARTQRRSALAPLRQEELRIDTEERKQRAASRLGDIETKQRTDAARDAASAPPRGARLAASAPQEPQEPPRPAGRLIGGTPKAPISAEERARREAESEAKFTRRQQDAERHRAEVAARNAERAAEGKVARPLPVPRGASSAL